MNYRTQLNAWALEMAIKAELFTNEDELLKTTQRFVDFTYNPTKDKDDHIKDFFEFVRNSDPGEAQIDALIGTLEHIKQDRVTQGVDKIDETAGAA